MNMRNITLALLAVAFVSLPLLAREEPAPALSVDIASPARLGKRTLDLGAVPVVVANRTSAELGVWREWCSWGWFQLTFEVRGPDGHVVTIRKAERGWDKNFPDHWTLAPGEPLVLTANLLDLEVWRWSSPIAGLRGKTLEVRAVFFAAEAEEGREAGVFHGLVSSPWRRYQLR
jgi:hypothetical protein